MKTKLLLLNLIMGFILLSCSKNDGSTNCVKSNAINSTYWPLKIGNNWSYILQNGNYNQNVLINEKIIYQDKEYTKIGNHSISGLKIPLFTREDLGVFTLFFPESNITYGKQTFSISSNIIKFLDTNTPVNITWENETQLDISLNPNEKIYIKHIGRVLENKINTFTVNETVYNNIIKVEAVQTIKNASINLNETYKYVYWLAKGVGPIQVEVTDKTGTEVYELTNYAT